MKIVTIPLPRYLFVLSRRMFITAAFSVAALLSTSLFLYRAQAQVFSGEQHPATATFVGASSTATAQTAADISQQAVVSEMHIANNGLVLLRNVRVISASAGVVRVEAVFGGIDFTWALRTDTNTQFIASTGEKETSADIRTGDMVTTTGVLAGGGPEPLIHATFVHER